jgi:streptogramin lyase
VIGERENKQAQPQEGSPSRFKPARWQWMGLVAVLGVLILGEFAFRWAKHRGWTTYTEDDGLAGDIVHSIAQAPDGKLWFGTENGIARFDGDTWITYNRIDMPASSIQSVALAPDGVLWFGSYYGISRFDGDTCTTYNADATPRPIHGPGLEPNWVQVIAVAQDGAVWFDTPGLEDRGVCRFDPAADSGHGGETWTTYTSDDGLASNSVRAIAVAPDGAVWFGTAGGGVSRFDGQGWTTYTAGDGLARNFVSSITVAPDGALWFGAGNGISHFDGESWTTHTTADGSEVESIAVGPDGVLWLYTGRGVSRFDGQTWVTYTPANSGLAGVAWGSPRGLAVDSQGRVWVGTWNGLSVLDERGSLPARPFHVLVAAWGIVRVALGIAALALLAITWTARRKPKAVRKERSAKKPQSIILWVLGTGLLLDLLGCLAVGKLTGQVWPLTYFVPIGLVLLVSLFVALVVYVAKREWTTIIACIVLVLAALAYLALFLSGVGLIFAY